MRSPIQVSIRNRDPILVIPEVRSAITIAVDLVPDPIAEGDLDIALYGTASLSAVPTLETYLTSSINAAGTLAASIEASIELSAAFNMGGMLGAAVDIEEPTQPEVDLAAALTGSGSLGASIDLSLTLAAGMSGTGALTAAPITERALAASIQGSGAVSASAIAESNATIAIQGAGTLTAAVTITVPPSYDSDAATLFAAWSTDPGSTRKGLYDDLIVGLKTDGIWAKLAGLQIYAAHSSQAALVDVKNPARTASAVSSPTFTIDRGYSGDAVAAYIDTGIPDLTGGITQDSVSFGGYINLAGSTNSGYLVWWGNNNCRIVAAASARARTPSNLTLTGSVLGFWAVNRVNSGNQEAFKNGVSAATGANVSSSVLVTNLHTHKFNSTAFGNSRIAVVFTSIGLTSTEQSNLYSRINTFLTAIGAN